MRTRGAAADAIRAACGLKSGGGVSVMPIVRRGTPAHTQTPAPLLRVCRVGGDRGGRRVSTPARTRIALAHRTPDVRMSVRSGR